MQNHPTSASSMIAGLYTMSLRLVVGWTYFSAFWRRMILTNKLDPDTAGYIGEKFNHFLPNALGIKPIIEYLVSNPESLWWAMLLFTIIEAATGLLLMLGFMTRLMSISVIFLALGILFGAGWLGTTCLDEWQIGVLGFAAGLAIFFSGGGSYSLDQYLKRYAWGRHRTIQWLASGELPWYPGTLKKTAFAGALFALFITLFTNQYFHGGVWGVLHNKSVSPKLEMERIRLNKTDLSFNVFRTEGADVYGSFLIGITLHSAEGDTIIDLNSESLASLPARNIKNHYVARIKPGKHSLVIPLGAKATITLTDDRLSGLAPGSYSLTLTDISGITWEKEFIYQAH